jgi:glutamine synthetase
LAWPAGAAWQTGFLSSWRVRTSFSGFKGKMTCHRCRSTVFEPVTTMKTTVFSLDERLQQLRSAGVHSVFAQFTDLLGSARGKLVPLTQVQQLIDEGAGFSGPSIWGTGLPRSGPRSEYHGRIVPESLQALPWWPGVARAVCNGYAGGQALQTCSRQVLVSVLQQFKHLGLTAWVGIEPEFFVFKQGSPLLLQPADDADQQSKPSYDFSVMQRQAEWLQSLRSQLLALDFQLLQIDHEDANGQWEVNYAYDEALQAADRYLLFKMTAQSVTAHHGMVYSSMPKPFAHAPGSGLHFHLSLTDESGQPVFADASDAHGLSLRAKQFVAGLLHHAPALAAVCAPTVNSYKRLGASASQSGTTWSPNLIAWGDNNRTALVRSVAARIEWRLPDPSTNVYAALAATLSAGLLGIQQQMTPPAPIDDDMYEMSAVQRKKHKLQSLPQDLGQALTALRRDQALRHTLGEAFCEEFLQLKQQEWQDWQTAVTDWERARYGHVC